MKELPQTVENIKAESFLATLMESVSEAGIEFQGVFSRNYISDIIDIEDDTTTSSRHSLNIRLSRDSLFHILPEGLFFRENELRKVQQEKNEEKFKALEEKIIREKQRWLDFFYPFDKTYFRLRFELERQLNGLAESRTTLLLDELFDIFQLDEKNDLIRKMLPILPLASEIRGNKMIWRDILKNVFFPANVGVRISQKTNAAGIRRGFVRVTIHIEKLSNQEFKRIRKDVEPFALFFREWFIPADMGCEFKIKDLKEPFVLGGAMTLDYNTQIKQNI